MLRASRIPIGLALLALMPSSCSPVLVWNDDGRTMSDLRALRHQRGRQSVALSFGARLYADEIHYTDKHKRTGEAIGHVVLSLGTVTQSKWLVKYGYAGHALFDKSQR